MPYEGQTCQSRPAGGQPDIDFGAFTLRRWHPADAAQLVRAFQDPEIQHWNLRTLGSITEAEALIRAWRQGWRRSVAASWAIVRTERTSAVLGQIGFRSLFLAEGLAEVSYWVIPTERGHGLATRAAGVLAKWGMAQLALERIELVHSVRNVASCHVALRAGYEFEGIKRRLQRSPDGERDDMCLHARIRDDGQSAADPRLVPLRIRIAELLDRSVRSGDVGGRCVGLQTGG